MPHSTPSSTSKPKSSTSKPSTRALTNLTLQRQILDQETATLDLMLSSPGVHADGAENGDVYPFLIGRGALDETGVNRNKSESGRNRNGNSKRRTWAGVGDGEDKAKVSEEGGGKVSNKGEAKMVKEMRDRRQEIELEKAMLEVERELVFLREALRGMETERARM